MSTKESPILVINNGSSSLKFSVLDPKSEAVLSSGLAERIGTEEAFLKLTDLEQVSHQEELGRADHRSALLRVIEILSKKGQFDCRAIGHRIVHGGEYFRDPVLVTDSVLQKIEELAALAPLHNPANALGIRVATDLFPGKPQVAVFDTAFHQTLPPYAFHYAIPYEHYEKYRIRRYGFHGTSHQYVTLEAARRLGKPYQTSVSFGQTQFISAHLGNGCSATAVKNGQSVDTTMGLTPLEGLVMGTRSGDVDPSLLLFLQEREGLRLAEIVDMLTRKSGLLGVSGVSHDMRSVITAADEGNARAKLAIDLFCYRLGRAILGLASSLTSIDAVIFTGGVGENSAFIRSKVLSHLAILHAEIDPKLNDQNGKNSDGRITTGSGLLCLVIPTNEELMIARETDRLVP
jgi:acetate kinase